MDLKIKIGAAQEVDFQEFLGTTDFSNIMYGEWINLLLGKPTNGIPQELLDQYNKDNIYSFDKVFEWVRERMIEWIAPKLKGWGGREQVAYCEEFFTRIGFKRVKNGSYWRWGVA